MASPIDVDCVEHGPSTSSTLPEDLDVTLLIPCLHEQGTLAAVVDNGIRFLEQSKVKGEVLVSDNGSTDGSVELATRRGARVVHASTRGYGAALRQGIRVARGRYIVMGDADDTYNFEEISPFLEQLRKGADLVMGTRLPTGTINWRELPLRDKPPRLQLWHARFHEGGCASKEWSSRPR
jgi:glycosyltransferase involved in cell wall biosynthesis